MKTLTGSCLKIFSCKNREKDRGIWCPRHVFLGRQETGFLELLIVAENLTQLRESDGNDASQMEKPVTEKSPAMVAESITEEKEESGFDTCDELSSIIIAYAKINDENLLSLKEESRLDADERVPVIVPGLILMPEEASVHEEGKMSVSNTLVESERAKEFNVTQVTT